MKNRIFLGYPQQPAKGAEVLRTFANAVSSDYEAVTWEDLTVSGKVVMDRVRRQIEDSDFCIYDLTRPSENVLFEIGFTIARAKPLWLILDRTVAAASRTWKGMGLFTEIGYTGYANSADLQSAFTTQQPVRNTEPLYDSLIEPHMSESWRTSLLYCPPFAAFEASNRLTELIEKRAAQGLSVMTADPAESSLNTFSWYAAQLSRSAGVLINLAGSERVNHEIHNHRNAVVAGLAAGLEVPLLILAEDDYSKPFDYADLLRVYETSAACVSSASQWLDTLELDVVRVARRRVPRSRLAGLRFGEHVAENELAGLSEYFVPTAAYDEVVGARDSIFVGHRGTGKTANALRAYEEIAASRNNFAILIKPASFEFTGLLAAVDRLPEHSHDYLFDTLWRFVVQTELAGAILRRLDKRPSYLPLEAAEDRFVDSVESLPFDVRADLSQRLDQVITHLLDSPANADDAFESKRVLINEAFHLEALSVLRGNLGHVLGGFERVAVFVDNLDKGWEKRARLDVLARLILGLLTARGRIVQDFHKEDWWRTEVHLTMALFLRSDIYSYLRVVAREPDKLNVSSIRWNDPEVLLRVLEERVEATWQMPGSAPMIWGDVFEGEVDGVDSREFVMNSILPRPRDLVFLANAALSRAVDRRHDTVTSQDLKDAAETYSQYAYEALLVENGVTIPEMENVLYSFLGSPSVIDHLELSQRLDECNIDNHRRDKVLSRLIEMSFLGIEDLAGRFSYPEVGTEMRKALALAVRLQAVSGLRRYRIHPAFHRFLEVRSDVS